jgi:hypothetical protein
MKHPDRLSTSTPMPLEEFQELAELQQALALALTQGESQRRNIADPSVSLGQPEHFQDKHSPRSDCLQGIDPSELQRASETLIRKRISQTRHLLPLTTGALATSFPKLFRAFATRHHFDSNAAILLDAIYFARWLSTQQSEPNWIIELARWESLRLSVLRTRFAIKLLCTRFDWVQWFTSEQFAPPWPRRGIWIAIRAGTWLRVWRVR